MIDALQYLLVQYGPARLVDRVDDVRPMNLFPGRDCLYLTDQNTNSIRRYSAGVSPKLEVFHKFKDGEINWFSNYDPRINSPWMLVRNSGRLILFDEHLKITAEYDTPFTEGFFFTYQERRFLISAATPSEGLFEVRPNGLIPVMEHIPYSVPRDKLIFMYTGDTPVFLLMDSRKVLRFTGKTFSMVAQLRDLPGRLYAVRYNPDTLEFVILSANSRFSELYFFDKEFGFLRRTLLPESISPGTMCLTKGHVHIGSRQIGYVNTYAIRN